MHLQLRSNSVGNLCGVQFKVGSLLGTEIMKVICIYFPFGYVPTIVIMVTVVFITESHLNPAHYKRHRIGIPCPSPHLFPPPKF